MIGPGLTAALQSAYQAARPGVLKSVCVAVALSTGLSACAGGKFERDAYAWTQEQSVGEIQKAAADRLKAVMKPGDCFTVRSETRQHDLHAAGYPELDVIVVEPTACTAQVDQPGSMVFSAMEAAQAAADFSNRATMSSFNAKLAMMKDTVRSRGSAPGFGG